MKARLNNTLAAVAVLAALSGWSGASQACPAQPYVSAVCTMANNYAPVGYMQANGQLVSVVQAQALYTLIGTTFGGSPNVNFNLPDLRGRFLLGAGQQPGNAAYRIGDKGGAETVMLTPANLPPLTSSTQSGTVTIPAATGTVDLSTVTGGTATLSGLSFTANANGLNLMASDQPGQGNTANGNALGTANTPSVKLYVNATPNVNMAAGSISGTVNGTIPATTAKIALQGQLSVPVPQQTVNLSAPVSVPNPGQQPISIMPPYLVMNYYIAVDGDFPAHP